MNTLTVDIGNSLTKLDFWCDNGFFRHETIQSFSPDPILHFVEEYDLKGVIISSVKKETADYVRELDRRVDCLVVNFDYEEIKRFYDLSHYSGSLGPDRMAAILGAEVAFPKKAKVVMDLGTAMTIDVVSKHGVFMGGTISLGLSSRLKALAHATSKLPSVADGCECHVSPTGNFGNDTRSAIVDGAFNGLTGEIKYALKAAAEKYGAKMAMITGGDAPQIFESVCFDSFMVPDPHLVGRGLDYHLRTRYLKARVGKFYLSK